MNKAEFENLIATKRAKWSRRKAAPIGDAIAPLLKSAKQAFRKSEAARRAWRQVAPQSLVDRCDVWVDRDRIVVECRDGVAFEQALRIRQAFWREALTHFGGLDSPIGIRVLRAEGRR